MAYILILIGLLGAFLVSCSDNPAENPQGKPSKQVEETH